MYVWARAWLCLWMCVCVCVRVRAQTTEPGRWSVRCCAALPPVIGLLSFNSGCIRSFGNSLTTFGALDTDADRLHSLRSSNKNDTRWRHQRRDVDFGLGAWMFVTSVALLGPITLLHTIIPSTASTARHSRMRLSERLSRTVRASARRVMPTPADVACQSEDPETSGLSDSSLHWHARARNAARPQGGTSASRRVPGFAAAPVATRSRCPHVAKGEEEE